VVECRVLIIVRNLPVPPDRRVWLECQALISAGYRVAVVCPKGCGDPAYEVVDAVELYKYRPHAPGGGKFSFVAEYGDHQESAYLGVYERVLGQAQTRKRVNA
jgi:hypothetical protein